MTRNETEDSVDLWRQVASAVEYIAGVERPGFSVWAALAEASQRWLSDAEDVAWTPASDELDPLRQCLVSALAMVPPAGSAGGASMDQVLSSALEQWLAGITLEMNLGQRFR